MQDFADEDEEHVRYNFGPASTRDDVIFGCVRPGYQSNRAEYQGAVEDAEVAEWVQWMKGRGVTHVLSLLEDEVAWYDSDLDAAMHKAFPGKYARECVHDMGARNNIHDTLRAVRATPGSKLVCHCSHGEGRASLGLGMWLVLQHRLSPEDAVAEIKATATEIGVKRSPDTAKLASLLLAGSVPR